MKYLKSSIIISSIAGLISYFVTENYIVALAVMIIALILSWIYNPKKRYWRAFWYIATILGLTNNWSFEFFKKMTDSEFHIKYSENSIVSIFLGILLIMLPILDFLERNGKIRLFGNSIKGDDNIQISDVKKSKITIKKDK